MRACPAGNGKGACACWTPSGFEHPALAAAPSGHKGDAGLSHGASNGGADELFQTEAAWAMSRRPDHRVAGLGFILACILIAFIIFISVKTGESTTAGNATDNLQASATDANQSEADLDANAGESAALTYAPPDPDTSDAPSTSASPSAPDDSQTPPGRADGSINGGSAYRACINGMPVPSGMADSEKPALCGCLIDRLQSYGTSARKNVDLAVNMCRLQWVTDRGRFDRTYVPGTTPPDTSPSDSLVPDPQAMRDEEAEQGQ